MLKATIVIPCYRAESTLERCLLSLIGQRAAFSFEVLVIENGSDDQSPAIAGRLAGESAGRLRVIEEPRPGSYTARNRGLDAARGGIIAFTDADCRAEEDWLARLVAALEDPEVLIAGGEILGEEEHAGLLARYATRAGILSQKNAFTHPRGPFFQTANLAVRRDVAQGVGGFDEHLYSGGDASFCWRVAAKFAGRFELVKEARIHHAHRDDVGGLFRQFRRYGQADVCLTKRFGFKGRAAVVKLGADGVRVLLLPLLALIGLLRGILERDPVPAVAPWLRVVRIAGRRWGQLTAWMRPGRLHRT